MIKRPFNLLWILLPVNLVFRLIVALRPLKYIDGTAIPDDAYLALTLARNIAKGLGPLYSLDFTNGFQPLYVFFMAPVYWLFPDNAVLPVHIALIVLAIFDTLSLWLIYLLVKRFADSAITPLLAGLAWIFNPYIMLTSANGLETIIAFFFLLLAYYFYHSADLGGSSGISSIKMFVFGVLIGLAVLARIDNAIFAIIITAFIASGQFRNDVSIKCIFGNLLLLAIGSALTYLPWLIYSYRLTGDIIPISGKAVRYLSLSAVNHQPTFSNWYSFILKWSIGTIVKYNILLITIPVVIVIVGRIAGYREMMRGIWTKIGPHMPLLLNALAIFLFYTFYIFTVWYFKRYYFPIVLTFIILFAMTIDHINIIMVTKRTRDLANAAIITAIVLFCLLHPSFRALYISANNDTMGYMNIGLWAKDQFKPGTVVGSCQTGAIGYFADSLTVINLDGVVNKKCFEALKEKRAIDYMKETGVEYFIDWDANRDFIERESRNFRSGDLRPLEKIEGFSSWRHDWFVYKVGQGY